MTPLATLLELVRQKSSGELVCVSEGSELHVFLQAGRLAWATDSSAPFAFGRHLLEHTSLTKETFHEVLESCRRDRLPLGETLISWQLVTLEEIRAALSHQIRGALATLVACRDGRNVFLERGRQFASYDVRLTFDVEALLPESPATGDASNHAELLQALAPAVPQARWLELMTGASAAVHPPSHAPCCVELAARFSEERARAFVLRTGSATHLGMAVGESDASLWCALEPEAAFGTIQTTIANEIAGWSFPPRRRSERPEPASRAWPQVIGDGPGLAALKEFVDRVPEVTGALVVDRGVVTGVLRRGGDAESIRELVLRRAKLFGLELPVEERSDSMESLGYDLCSVAVADEQAWCFGAEMGADHSSSVWILLERDGAQGLGWAYLASLRRSVEGGASARQWEVEWNKVG